MIDLLWAVETYLVTYLSQGFLAETRTYEIHHILTGHEIPNSVACDDHEFILIFQS